MGEEIKLTEEELEKLYEELEVIIEKLDLEGSLESLESKTLNQDKRDFYMAVCKKYEKKIEGSEVTEVQKKLYEFCKREIDEEDEEVEEINKILEKNPTIKSMTTIKSIDDLEKVGRELLPNYREINAEKPIKSVPFFIDMIVGKRRCRKYYRTQIEPDEELVKELFKAARWGYQNNDTVEKYCDSLTLSEAPEVLKNFYIEKTESFFDNKGLSVWIGKKKNQIIVAFGGTDWSDNDMVMANITQLTAPSFLYLRAAGLLKVLLEEYPHEEFIVVGHSLGGGLA